MTVLQKLSFRKVYKKLKPNQKADADAAIDAIIASPEEVGVQKKGDLSGIYIYKFKMVGQLTLIAYTFEEESIVLTFLAIGSHENFYRNSKN